MSTQLGRGRSFLTVRLLCFAISLAAIIAAGCGVVFWREIYSCTQSDGGTEIRIEELCGLADCSVKIVATRGGQTTQIDYRRGCNVHFAHAAWVGPVVGVFVDGSSCQTTEAAYDASTQRSVPFSSVEGALRTAIVRDYGVTEGELQAAGGDVLKWAANADRSRVEFRRRHPH
jgi:hypothetical protein